MDGENYSQAEHQQTAHTMYGVSSAQSPFSAPFERLSSFPLSTSFTTYFQPQALASENQHCLNTTAAYPNLFNGQNLQETDYAGLTAFQPKNGDYTQDTSYFDDLSNNSLFSSPADSLSDIADAQEFLPADSLINSLQWDANLHQQNSFEPFPSRFTGLNSLEELAAIINTPPLAQYQPQPPAEDEDEGDSEESEELGHAETYAEYVPPKSKIGKQHPDRVVETSTLSSVPPPDITYSLSFSESTIDEGLLSALQLEAIIYACQQHEVILHSGQRAGFLIGDGAGVGKGRTVAGIIFENYLKGRKKSLWFSVSNDLMYDALRDLQDIDAQHIPVHALNKIKYGDTATSEGVLFATYSALIGESQAGGQHRTRLKQILDWCDDNFDGVIVFDECHKAKNASSTKMGKAVLELQKRLPLARVVYASATGHSDLRELIYLCSLGLWTQGSPFRFFAGWLHAIEERGVGAMEIVAMDMKVSGMYIARQLSFTGVTFRIEEIPLDKQFLSIYNKSAQLWAHAMEVFQRAADWIGLESRKSLWGQFWSAHQRFFKYLCIAAKVRRLVELATEELGKGKCIVIGLQSTGESRTREVLDENDGQLNCFVSAAEGVFLSLIQKHFPSTRRRRDRGNGMKRKRKLKGRASKVLKPGDFSDIIRISDDSSSDSEAALDSDFNSSPESVIENDNEVIFVSEDKGTQEQLEKIKIDLLQQVKNLGRDLPLNTLDQLIDLFGGPDKVAEMTGRKGRVVRRPDGVCFESRAEQGLSIDNVNLKEKERFMNGEKVIAIISEASSSGISLQADRRKPNQKRRVHMTLELPWSADRAIQQFGRTHRSNQVFAPEYIFLISELAGERRFASIVAKRLESLGALTHGDRRATESRDLSKYNFENKYGAKALDRIIKAVIAQQVNHVSPPKNYPGGDAEFFRDMKHGLTSVGIFCKENRYGSVNVEKDCSITKFLNRILGLEVHKQNSLFQYFIDTFEYLIERDKKEGKYDMGILDLAPGVDEIYEESQQIFLTPGYPQNGQVVLYKISVDRGLPWQEALEKSQSLTGPNDGFYVSFRVEGNKPNYLLSHQSRGKRFTIPNLGRESNLRSLTPLSRRYRRTTSEEAKELWEEQYQFSFSNCSHAAWSGNCKLIQEGKDCFQGTRLRHYYMLCGALLRVWNRIVGVMSDVTSSSYLPIVRLKTKEQKKQVGIKIPKGCVQKIIEELKHMDAEVKKKIQQEKLRQEEKQCQLQALQQIHECQHQPLDLTHRLITPTQYMHSDDVLDLTYSPQTQSMPDVVLNRESGVSDFLPEVALYHHHQQQVPLGLSIPFGSESYEDSLLGLHRQVPLKPPLHEPFQHNHLQNHQQQQEDPLQQEINFREILEEMLRTMNVPQNDDFSQSRQSVIQFGGPLTDFWDVG
ncbi:protein strawberry notch homolog 2 [Protopterus annectens]|uniref:protein strawberry notch homolog 2 n=1 Tax=Protopterus annectens TaxID=7888 RepID=UPI001CFB0029|nr:protein strawberry notch homolog 2 [Protopterus annectens]